MRSTWPEPVERVSAFLREAGAEGRIEQFAEGIAACTDESLRPVLESLQSLFALSRFEADRGWFLEKGYFEGVKAGAVREQVNRLLEEIRPHAVPLVDAFGIPDTLIAAPIGLR